MILQIKSFIYRFFVIFGLNIFLAEKERQEYINSKGFNSKEDRHLAVGLWEVKNGFCQILTSSDQSFLERFSINIRHAFNFKRYRKGKK